MKQTPDTTARSGIGRYAAIAVALLAVAAVAFVDWRTVRSLFRGMFVLQAADFPGRYEYTAEEAWYTIENDRFGIDGNGRDAQATTDGINQALAWASATGWDKVRLCEGTYLIRSDWSSPYKLPTGGIEVPSGMTLDLGDAVLIIEPNASPSYCIIAIAGKSDVTVLGGRLIGDRYGHDYGSGGTHEWGFGVAVAASTDVLIQDMEIRDTTGDGIILEGSYVPLAENGRQSTNVRVYGCRIGGCRRQGVSVVGATDSVIAGNEIFGIGGTDPQYGIDVEPGLDYGAHGVKIHDNLIYGCAAGAISCHGGSGYEVYRNRCIGNNIIAVSCSDVSIYGNMIASSKVRVHDTTADVRVYDNVLDLTSRLIKEE